jgi:hypothetical protein
VFLDVRRAALVRTDVSEDHIAFIVSVTRIGEVGSLATIISSQRESFANVLISPTVVNHDDGCAAFLRNVRSYKSHTVYRARRRHPF